MNHPPRQVPNGAAPGSETPFRMQIKLGECVATSREVEGVISSLRADWPGTRYHILRSNCNAFADELAIRLTGIRIPGWVNRAATMGAAVECLLPSHMRAGGAGAGAPAQPSSLSSLQTRMPEGGGHSLGDGGGGGGGVEGGAANLMILQLHALSVPQLRRAALIRRRRRPRQQKKIGTENRKKAQPSDCKGETQHF